MPYWRTHAFAFRRYIESAGYDPEETNPLGSVLPDILHKKLNGHIIAQRECSHHDKNVISLADETKDGDYWWLGIGMAHHIALDKAFHEGIFFQNKDAYKERLKKLNGSGNSNRIYHSFVEALVEEMVMQADRELEGWVREWIERSDFNRIHEYIRKHMCENGLSGRELGKNIETFINCNGTGKVIRGKEDVGCEILESVGIEYVKDAMDYMDSLLQESVELMRSEFGLDRR